jgi:hypothetical protein
MSSGILLENLTSQQLLRNLANRIAGVFGLTDYHTYEIDLNSRERALFRNVLHEIAVAELWITRVQFRQFFGTIDKTGMGGGNMRSHASLMESNPAHDDEARLYQQAYVQLSQHVIKHTKGASQPSVAV